MLLYLPIRLKFKESPIKIVKDMGKTSIAIINLGMERERRLGEPYPFLSEEYNFSGGK